MIILTQKRFIIRLSIPVLCIAMLLAFSGRVFAKNVYDPIFIETMMEDWKMKENVSKLAAVTADPDLEHIGLLFKDGDTFRIYLDGKLIHTKKMTDAAVPNFFRVTDDGHLLYYLGTKELYVDGVRISGTSNKYAYNIGLKLEHVYRRGKVIFTEDSSIRSYDIKTKRTTVLHRHKGEIAYSRIEGAGVYYSAYDSAPLPGYYIFKDGKKVTYKTVESPRNFDVIDGHTYFLHQTKGPFCVLYKDEQEVISNAGVCGFLYADEKGNVYYAVAVEDSNAPANFRVRLYEDGKSKAPQRIYNIERTMGFGSGSNFAVRVRTQATSQDSYRLLKNGRLTGQHFDFSAQRDQLGVQFGPDNLTYMRNLDKGQWKLYEDGKIIFPDTFQNLFYFHADDEKVTMIGTRPLSK